MSRPAASLYQKLALSYKCNRFPWKKHALIGYDLKGNEYWDCPNPLGKSKYKSDQNTVYTHSP